jgi:hypothetical protein
LDADEYANTVADSDRDRHVLPDRNVDFVTHKYAFGTSRRNRDPNEFTNDHLDQYAHGNGNTHINEFANEQSD